MKLIGEVSIYRNNELILSGRNSIEADLKNYFQSLMDSISDQAIDNLFTNDGVVYGGGTGGQDGLDGIVLAHDLDVVTMITTEISASNTHGRKWKGEWTNDTGADRTIFEFAIGHNMNADAGNNPASAFEYGYARYDPADLVAQSLDNVVIEWEIYIS